MRDDQAGVTERLLPCFASSEMGHYHESARDAGKSSKVQLLTCARPAAPGAWRAMGMLTQWIAYVEISAPIARARDADVRLSFRSSLYHLHQIAER